MDITRLPKPPLFAPSEAASSELACTYSASEVFPLRTGCHGDRSGLEDVYKVTEHVKVRKRMKEAEGLGKAIFKFSQLFDKM